MVKAVGFILYKRKNSEEPSFLVLRANYGCFHCTPPKGHVEEGENELDTALRELEEETGYTKEDIDIISNFRIEANYSTKEGYKTTVYYLAKLLDENKDVKISEEHQKSYWIKYDQQFGQFIHDSTRSNLKQAHDFILKYSH